MMMEHIPVRFFGFAVITRDQRGAPTVRPRSSDETGFLNPDHLRQLFPPGSKHDICVVLRSKHIAHYFHFLELVVMLFSIKKEFFFDCSVARIFVGSQVWDNPFQNNVQVHILDCLYPRAEVVEWFDRREFPAQNVVVLDPELAVTSINKFLEPGLELCMKWGPALREHVYGALGIRRERPSRSQDQPVTTYITRTPPPRGLLPELEAVMLAEVRRVCRVTPIDFAKTAWREQVNIAAQTDIMIAVHGNGLSNLLWLPPWAVVIEIFPEGVHHYDYQVFSEIVGLDYFGIEHDVVYRDFSRCGPARAHREEAVKPVTTISWDAFSLALTAGLSRSARRKN